MSLSVGDGELPWLDRLREDFGAWRCSRGHHATLVWRPASERRMQIRNEATEMFVASGLYQLAKWIGWCPRCDRSVEWSTHKPKGPR